MSAKVTQKYSIIHIWNLLSNGASSVGFARFFELVLLLPISLEAVVLRSTRLLRFATDPSAIDHTTHTLTMYVQYSRDGRTNHKKLNEKSTSRR